MDQTTFNQMMEVWLEERAVKSPQEWSKKSREWAEENNIIQGDPDGSKRYQSFITREEAITMLHRVTEL